MTEESESMEGDLTEILERIPVHWGRWISCQPGWYPLIIKTHKMLDYLMPGYEIHQIKEKYGQLRFYWGEPPGMKVDPLVREIAYAVEHEAEFASGYICEQCGNPARNRCDNYWYQTVCLECVPLREGENTSPGDLPPYAGGLHGEIPDTSESRSFFRQMFSAARGETMSANGDIPAMSANGDTHDPLCPPPWKWGEGGHCEGCDLIAKARADEREQMKGQTWCHRCDRAMRVEWGTDKITGDTVATGYCPSCTYGFLMLMDEFVSTAAARGETS